MFGASFNVGFHIYFLPIIYLLAITTQRVLYSALIAVDLGNVVFINMITFLGIFFVGTYLWLQVPRGWGRNIGPLKWLIMLSFCEAFGNALMIITLKHSDLIFQTIVSKGCEFAGVLVLSNCISSSSENHISKKNMFFILSICFLASIVLPIISSVMLGSVSFWVVPLVACRSLIFTVCAMGEQVLVQNHGVHPHTILITEAIGGAIVTLAVLWPLSHFSLDESIQQLSLNATWDVFMSRRESTYVALSFLIIAAFVNTSRVSVVRSTTALAYEIGELIQTSLIFIVMYGAYYITCGGYGQKFNVEEFVWMFACLIMTAVASGLYFSWDNNKCQLFKFGLVAQKAAGMSPTQAVALDVICISGRRLPRSVIGCYAGCEADYVTLFPFFEKIALICHEIKELPNDPKYFVDLTVHELPLVLTSIAHIRWTQLASVHFCVSRNIAGCDFSPKITKQSRLRVLDMSREGILSYQPYATAQLDWTEVAMADCPSEWPHREYDSLEIANILRDWPEGRAKFTCTVNAPASATDIYDKGSFELSVIVNKEEHLSFYATAATPSFDTVELMYCMLQELVQHMGSQLPYAFHPRFGYLQTNISNLGTGFKISLQDVTGQTVASKLQLGVSVDEIAGLALKDYAEEEQDDKNYAKVYGLKLTKVMLSELDSVESGTPRITPRGTPRDTPRGGTPRVSTPCVATPCVTPCETPAGSLEVYETIIL